MVRLCKYELNKDNNNNRHAKWIWGVWWDIYIYTYARNKKRLNLKQSKDRFMGEFGERKGKG